MVFHVPPTSSHLEEIKETLTVYVYTFQAYVWKLRSIDLLQSIHALSFHAGLGSEKRRV